MIRNGTGCFAQQENSLQKENNIDILNVEKKIHSYDYLRWKISCDPHADGIDRGNLRDAGEAHACWIII